MSWKGERFRKAIGAAGLAAAIALLALGAAAKRDVFILNAESIGKEFGLPPPFESLSDLQVVIDSTFTGIVRKDGKLHSTYDRAMVLTKRACPT